MNLLERVVGLIAPHDCISCSAEGSLVCDWCRPDIFPALPARCYRCHKLSSDSAVCKTCRAHSPLKQVWVRTVYEDASKELVYRLKFARTQAAAVIMAETMTAALPFLEPDTIIVHIPTASSRVRQRGYDQAELIAEHLSKLLGRKHIKLLSRHGQSRQVGAKRKDRIRQLEGAFRVKQDVTNRNILLIDDVTTTGATLEAAAKVLKRAGAKSIAAATFAQAQIN